MEISRENIAEFHHEDVAIYVRAKANELDKALFDALTHRLIKEVIAHQKPRIGRDLAQLFVCGWSGVTIGGSPVAYSWALLEEALPPSVMSALETFVGET